MNEIKITPLYRTKINGQHLDEPPITIPITTDLIITPALLLNYYPNMNLSELYGCNTFISCDSFASIAIADFDYFSLISFRDAQVILKYLKIYNAKDFCRFTGITAERLDIESSNCCIFDSEIKSINYGIETNYNSLRGNHSPLIELNKNHKTVSIQNSKISDFTIHSYAHSIQLSHVNMNTFTVKENTSIIQVTDFSDVNNLKLDKTISSLEINNSTVGAIFGSRSLSIKSVSTTHSIITNVYNIYDLNITNHNMDAYEFFRKSYISANDFGNYSKYSFLQKDKIYKEKSKGKDKILLFILKHTCGFGYKVSTAIFFSIKVIIGFAVLFTILTFFGNQNIGLKIEESKNLLSVILTSFYHSIITFTTLGYGDTLGIDWTTKFLSAAEAILGIYSMGIIVFSITNSHITE